MKAQYTITNVMWIAWQTHRRTIELCNYLEIEPIIFSSNRNRFIKYPILLFKTVMKINKVRPCTLIVQNPSIILTLLACILKPLFRYKLIVDAHNAAIAPESTIIRLLTITNKYIFKVAYYVVVSNHALARYVSSRNGKAYILPDIIPTKVPYECDYDSTYNDSTMIFKIVVICTYGPDEPCLEMINATKKLKALDMVFYFTGNHKKIAKELRDSCANVNFTGYLSEEDYWKLLLSSNLIIDLTNRDNCLVCGAYEAVAAEVPLLLSNTKVLRDYFYKGAIFTDNTAAEISTNIIFARNNYIKLKKNIIELKIEIEKKWELRGKLFKKIIWG